MHAHVRPRDHADALRNPQKVNAKILVAEASTSMPADLMGDVPCVILNTSGSSEIQPAEYTCIP